MEGRIKILEEKKIETDGRLRALETNAKDQEKRWSIEWKVEQGGVMEVMNKTNEKIKEMESRLAEKEEGCKANFKKAETEEDQRKETAGAIGTSLESQF